MGGRGAKIGIKKQIEGASHATIHDDKIYKYYLNPVQKHYQEFAAVGYTMENAEQLRKDMLKGLLGNEVTEYKRSETGYTKAIVDMELGVTEKKLFRTVWGKDKEEQYFRNITAHRIKKKKGKE
ncbi:DUF6883 domain-containing protein [Holdemania sp. Marseille-P2844]|uniref:DUF6883 domain-containing protein n=1 Tax=Holdemania sp. Marseille-P2844 TaxID=1852366 RepID=UPI0009334162|nr:DUF6883 domain-containing protein [Holdemania sp. Marseille-P2844]